MRTDKRPSQRPDKKAPSRVHKRGVVGYSKKTALLEEAITHMNTGKYGRSSAALKELLALDPQNTEARRLFATLHLRLGSLVTARQAFESLANEAIGRQDYWLAESLLREYLAAGPRCVPFLEQLAYVYQEKGDELAAVGELGKAIEILRDDPDPDNPQKAAQLYSKIRELAPASSVAMQLATLFDVQTGEFLVRPSAQSSAHDDASSSLPDASATAHVEHLLPEVMPWEVTEETPAVPDSEARPAAPDATGEEAVLSTSSVIENVISTDQAVSESAQCMPVDESPLSFTLRTEETPIEPSADASDTTAVPSESVSPQASDAMPSHMPWEQMADASIQIIEPESPSPPNPGLLESILATLRTEDNSVTSEASVAAEETARQVEVEEPMAPAPAAAEETAPQAEAEEPMAPAPVADGDIAFVSLSSPMPWEQVSDAAMQIPAEEPAPLPLVEDMPFHIATAEPEPPALSAAVDVDPSPDKPALDQGAPPSSDSNPPSLSSSLPSADSAQPASFSWNSVFDKAWKFTAGTMAPSAPVPSRRGHEPGDQEQWGDAGPSSPETVDSPASIVPTAAVSSLHMGPSLLPLEPAVSVSSSAVVEEGAMHESIVEPTPPPAESSEHWNTGEVAIQVHRPSKKRKCSGHGPEEAEPKASAATSATESLSDERSQDRREWIANETTPLVEEHVSAPSDPRPDWMKATDTITFNRPAPPPAAIWRDAPAVTAAPLEVEVAPSAAASAVDMLFARSGPIDDARPHVPLWAKPAPRLIARLHRIRINIWSFIWSCFSTTRSLTFLVLMTAGAVVVVLAAGFAGIGLTWMAMEDAPSSLYQSLTVSPPRSITDAKKNGYLMLLGFDAPAGLDPLQAGYERKPGLQDKAAAQICPGGDEAKEDTGSTGASGQVVRGWVRSGDVLAQIKGQSGSIRSFASRESVTLARYQQWLTMPFDDWGFGQSLSPNCSRVLLAHRLYLLEGFSQDLASGIDRLETDMQAWRAALGQSKTLVMKMLAVTAVQDDASVASGLLARTELDGAALAQLNKIVRPLDQAELSVRWPMHSQFTWATKSVSAELRDDQARDRPWHAAIPAAMRLPIQRRANAYAEYYEAANKAVAGGRYTNLPKLSSFVRTPPSGVMDYLVNPVEHIAGVEPLPSWDPYVMRIVEVDAELRLAGLQAWIRRGPQEGDVLTRLAKAGRAYYDPFTGLPMLVNQRKGLIYSVGRDGKDQEGDNTRDVAVPIPFVSSSDSRRASLSPPTR
ncbi:MAG: hypothetical protein K0S79_1412 [Nitrospira sp.]|nr:hypothetical protein [Nitrospira sp.]